MVIFLIIILILFILLIGVSIYDGNRFVVENYEIKDSRITHERKVVFLTDLHNKQYGKENIDLFEAIRNINPDLILIGGDMMVARPKCSTKIAADFTGRLKTIAPVIYAMGNHEYRSRLYPETYGTMYDEYMDQLNEFGLDILDNDFEDFDNLRIYGLSIERDYYRRLANLKMDDSYIASLIGDPDTDKYNILLAHNPDYFKNYVSYGADLTLSGHVHGGIVRLPFIGGLISPKVTLFPRYNGGLYLNGSSKLIVSRGLGIHTIPIRFLNPGELSVITFKPED